MPHQRILDSRYEVSDLIGRGGMADVFQGRDLLNLPEGDTGFGVIKPSGSEQTTAIVTADQILVLPRDKDMGPKIWQYQLGANPRSGTSFFQARLPLPAAQPGTCDLTWNSVAGKTYVIEWSPDLATPFAAVKTVTASATETTENLTRSGPLGFYRVRPQ